MIGLRPAGHQADLAEANQRADVAEREAAMLRAMVEVLRLDRDAWREQARRSPFIRPARWAHTTARA
jgi:hypothetical protein